MHSASLCKNQIIECLMFASLLVGFSTYKSFKDKTRILKDVFLFIDLSQVFRHQLSVWMWTRKGPLSIRVCTMVKSFFKEDMNWYFLPRYLPRPENSDKKTCRSQQLRTIWDLFFSRIIWYREVPKSWGPCIFLFDPQHQRDPLVPESNDRSVSFRVRLPSWLWTDRVPLHSQRCRILVRTCFHERQNYPNIIRW